jgi:hypothetical protein
MRLLRELECSSRLSSALKLAGARHLTISDFCKRFPYPVLGNYRGFNRNTVVELSDLLAPFASATEVATWLDGDPNWSKEQGPIKILNKKIRLGQQLHLLAILSFDSIRLANAG